MRGEGAPRPLVAPTLTSSAVGFRMPSPRRNSRRLTLVAVPFGVGEEAPGCWDERCLERWPPGDVGRALLRILAVAWEHD